MKRLSALLSLLCLVVISTRAQLELPANPITPTIDVHSHVIPKHTLAYYVADTLYAQVTLRTGTEPVPVAAPVQQGHTFSHWSGLPTVMPDSDVRADAVYTVNRYLLSYVIDGDTVKADSLDYAAAITPEPVPARQGHTFSGWSDVPDMMPDHDVTVTGAFTVNRYLLTYIIDGDTVRADSLDYATAITPEPSPARQGHTFSGWSDVPDMMPDHDVTVTGAFTVNRYLLTYILDGDTVKADSLDYATAITPWKIEIPEHHEFSGWTDLPEQMPDHDVTVVGTLVYTRFTSPATTDAPVDIYTLSGHCVYRNVRLDDIWQKLPHGIYIISGRKIVR